MLSLGFVLCCWIMVVTWGDVHALTDVEKSSLHENLLPTLSECREEHNVETGALSDAHKSGNYDNINPCFFACIFKKTAFMNPKGMFDPAKALEKVKKFMTTEEKEKIATGIITKCSAVNDEKVSDGEAGCDRSKLMVNCIAEEKKKLKH